MVQNKLLVPTVQCQWTSGARLCISHVARTSLLSLHHIISHICSCTLTTDIRGKHLSSETKIEPEIAPVISRIVCPLPTAASHTCYLLRNCAAVPILGCPICHKARPHYACGLYRRFDVDFFHADTSTAYSKTPRDWQHRTTTPTKLMRRWHLPRLCRVCDLDWVGPRQLQQSLPRVVASSGPVETGCGRGRRFSSSSV